MAEDAYKRFERGRQARKEAERITPEKSGSSLNSELKALNAELEQRIRAAPLSSKSEKPSGSQHRPNLSFCPS